MTMKLRIAVIFTIMASLLAALPVLAGSPLDLHIVAEETFADVNDTFVITGAAVDAGVVCETGIVNDLDFAIQGNNPGLRILRVDKAFICDDGSGTFFVSMVVRLDLNSGETTARWRITGGNGDYADLRGRGSLVGIPIIPGESILDVYNGSVQ
jgi:hypothetical protein